MAATAYSKLRKFNPNHDARGRFSSSGGATSFTFAPGKSKAHDMAIARAKASGNAQTTTSSNRGHREEDGSKTTAIQKIAMIQEDLKCSEAEAKRYAQDIFSFGVSEYANMRSAQVSGKPPDSLASAKNIEDFISKSPSYSSQQPIMRGIELDNKAASNLVKGLMLGKSIDMLGVSSWTSDPLVAETFASQSIGASKQTSVVFTSKSNITKSASIQHISNFGKMESEVLVSKDAKFSLDGTIKQENGIYYVPIKAVN